MIGLNVQGLIDWAGKLGALGLVICFLVGFQQEWWYLPGVVRELRAALAEQKEATRRLEKDRDQWQMLYWSSARVAERGVAVAQAVAVLPPLPEPEVTPS